MLGDGNTGHDRSDKSSTAVQHESDLSLDGCLELLANRKRRLLLDFFIQSETDHAAVDQIIKEITDHNGEEIDQLDRTEITSTLRHTHLPKLADSDIIDYDRRNLEVRYEGDQLVEEVYTRIRELDQYPANEL